MATSEFKRKTIKGLRWGTIDQMSFMVITQLTNLVLMRLLGPTEFGIIGMANVFANFGNILVLFGIPAFIIQRQQLNDGILSTCFWANLILGASVTALLALTAPWIAEFYMEPRVKDILLVLSLLFVVESTSYVQRALLNRDLDLKSLFQARLISIVISCAIAIWIAVETQSVWAIVARIAIYKVLFTILTFLYKGWLPKWQFNRNILKELFRFTTPLLGSNSMDYFVRNFDTLMVGRVMGADLTGIYQKSYEFLQLPANNISHAVNRVMMASFSKIQNDKARIIDTYLKVSRMTAFVTFPLMIFLFVQAQSFVLGILGEQWVQMIPVVRIMSVAGIVISIAVLSPNIYISQGRTEIHFYNTLITSTLLVTGVLIGLNYGLTGVATGVSLAMLLGYLSGIFFVEKLIGLKVMKNLANYTRIAGAVILYGLALFALDHYFFRFFTSGWLESAGTEATRSLYYLLQFGIMGLISLPLYWGAASLLKTDYSAQLIEDFLSKRIVDKFKNIFGG